VLVTRVRPTVFDLRLHATELAALMAAVRWAVEGGPESLPADARDELRRILSRYDEQLARLAGDGGGPAGP
jgi:hypothetical protein